MCITAQSEMIGKNLKELYTQFFAKLIGLLCDDQTHSSLVDQLTSLSLISETDKETQLSSVTCLSPMEGPSEQYEAMEGTIVSMHCC